MKINSLSIRFSAICALRALLFPPIGKLPTVLFICLALGHSVEGSTSTPFKITKDPEAVAVVQKALAAMGGAQALLYYQDSEATGNATVYGGGTQATYPITLKSKGTQETRVEIQL